jgi:hypothetical protein
MRKLTTTKKTGKQQWFIDGVETSQYEFQMEYAKSKGYKNFYQFSKDRGYKARQLKSPEQTFRIKDEHTDGPEGIVEIPSAPGYYAMRDSTIWCHSEKRKRWIIITPYSNSRNHGYEVIQPYINGTRCVRYVHRLVSEAYNGTCPEDCEVHHIDGDNRNNQSSNLEIMLKITHRSMKRNQYKK